MPIVLLKYHLENTRSTRCITSTRKFEHTINKSRVNKTGSRASFADSRVERGGVHVPRARSVRFARNTLLHLTQKYTLALFSLRIVLESSKNSSVFNVILTKYVCEDKSFPFTRAANATNSVLSTVRSIPSSWHSSVFIDHWSFPRIDS